MRCMSRGMSAFVAAAGSRVEGVRKGMRLDVVCGRCNPGVERKLGLLTKQQERVEARLPQRATVRCCSNKWQKKKSCVSEGGRERCVANEGVWHRVCLRYGGGGVEGSQRPNFWDSRVPRVKCVCVVAVWCSGAGLWVIPAAASLEAVVQLPLQCTVQYSDYFPATV